MKRTVLRAVLPLISLLPLTAEVRALKPEEVGAALPLAVYQQGLEFVFPEVIVGGEWTSTLRITNRSSAAVPATNLLFVDNSGGPMNVTFTTTAGQTITAPGAQFTLDPGAILEATFSGGSNTQWGQAIIDLCHTSPCLADIYGEVTLRNRNPTRPDFESVFPLEVPATQQYMLFDHRAGLETVLYLCSASTSPMTVALDFRDIHNQLVFSGTVNLAAAGCQILNLNVAAPPTNGIQGTLSIRGSGLVTATALRINPSNSFTPLRAFVPKS